MPRKYAIKEVFATLQGEGAQAGSPAVFLRFAGCNLGYGVCPWCDTDWAKAEYTLELDDTLELVRATAEAGFGGERPFQVLGVHRLHPVGVAPGAHVVAQVAPREAEEHRGRPRLRPLALERREHFADAVLLRHLFSWRDTGATPDAAES